MWSLVTTYRKTLEIYRIAPLSTTLSDREGHFSSFVCDDDKRCGGKEISRVSAEAILVNLSRHLFE